MKKRIKYKPLILALSILVAVTALLGSTYAWFTSGEFVVNRVQTPPEERFMIMAVDEFDPAVSLEHKRVGAVNTEEKPGLVRLLVLPVFVLPSETPGDPDTLLPATIGGLGSDAMVIMKDFNGAHWVDATDFSAGGDGWFYYKHILDSGESTDKTGRNLFNEVEIMDPLPPEYEGAQLVIEVKCEAVGIVPAGAYLEKWWAGQEPPVDLDNPLHLVHLALQSALNP